MFETAKYLLYVSISIFAYLWVTKRFWDSFLERKKNSVSSVLPWLLLCASQFLMQLQIFRHGTSLWLALFNSLFILLVVLFSYQPTGLETYFLFAFFCIMWGSVELSLYSLFRFIDTDYQATRPMATVSSLILMMAFSYLVSLLSNKTEKAPLPSRLAFVLLLVPVGSIYIMIVQYLTGNHYFLSISVFAILILFNMITFDVYTKLSRFFLHEKENAVHEEQLSMLSKNMEEQKKLMDEFYEEKHNLINELTALRVGLSQENKEDAVKNLDQIIDCYHDMGLLSTSGNSTVDAVINAKYATAKEYGIVFRLQLCVPETLAVESRDLGVVIGNALDNAISAVKECELTEKVISISMGVKRNALVMIMKNPYEHTIKKNRSGDIQSTKPEKRKHGYGLRSIRRIAEAYAGDLIIDTENGWFTLTVILNLR